MCLFRVGRCGKCSEGGVSRPSGYFPCVRLGLCPLNAPVMLTQDCVVRFKRNGRWGDPLFGRQGKWATLSKPKGREARSMRQEQLARRDFRRFSSGVTPAIRNPSMRPEDARKDVHFHQFFCRINADKTIERLWWEAPYNRDALYRQNRS